MKTILRTGIICLSAYTLFIGASYAMSIKEIDILDATIYRLENKEPKTTMEDNILIVAKTLQENSTYLDEYTLKQFNDAAFIARIVEERNYIMKDKLSEDLAGLVEKQQFLYDNYLKATEKSYDDIAKLLDVKQRK